MHWWLGMFLFVSFSKYRYLVLKLFCTEIVELNDVLFQSISFLVKKGELLLGLFGF